MGGREGLLVMYANISVLLCSEYTHPMVHELRGRKGRRRKRGGGGGGGRGGGGCYAITDLIGHSGQLCQLLKK